jgi:hypothetical protein
MPKAIFDAILVHMMNLVSPGTWHGLKMDLCDALVKNKDAITLQILANSYAKTDIVFLQVPRAFPLLCGSPHSVARCRHLRGKHISLQRPCVCTRRIGLAARDKSRIVSSTVRFFTRSLTRRVGGGGGGGLCCSLGRR